MPNQSMAAFVVTLAALAVVALVLALVVAHAGIVDQVRDALTLRVVR